MAVRHTARKPRRLDDARVGGHTHHHHRPGSRCARAQPAPPRGQRLGHSCAGGAGAGPGNALAYHAAYEFGGDVTALPAGDVWLDTINQTPPQDRHFAVHDQHLIALNRADAAAWAAGSWKAITHTTLTGSADEIGRRVNEIAAQGITEIIYQPTGPDIAGELAAFHTAARTAVSAAAQDTPGDGLES